MSRQLTIGPATEGDTQRSLAHVIFILVTARYGALSIGGILLLWGAAAVLLQGESLSFRGAIEIAVVAVLGPAIVWVSSSWAERLAREASQSHQRLFELNRLTQHEVAERQRAEEELRRSEQKAVKTLQELEMAQQNLVQAEKLSAIGELVAGVAHELNNPLTGILGFSQLLLGSDLDPEVRQDVERIAWEAQRSARVVQNLLSFARMQELQKVPTDLNDTLARTVEIKSYDLRVSSIEVEMNLQQGLPYVLADAGQLQTVFLNLINNAQDAIVAAHGGGTLRVSTSHAGDVVRVSITDDGPGIPVDHQNKLFDPFFTTKAVGKGTGLGLSICHGIVASHQGRIWVESEYGSGATFHMEFPIAAEESVEEGPDDTCEPVAATGGRILVIDDEQVIRDLVVAALTRSGYQVDSLADARTVLDSLEDFPYDLLLVDLKMPGIDGKEFFELLSQRRPELALRVIFVTGDEVSIDAREFLEAAGRPVISKPFDLDALSHLVATELCGRVPVAG